MTAAPPPKAHKTALLLTFLVFLMLGLSFASVPFYRLFCQLTGFGGTTMRAEKLPEVASTEIVTVRFNADTNPALPWDFKPKQVSVEGQIGAPFLAFFEAKNTGNAPSSGTATFNVTPLKAGKYFHKIQCFCFSAQVLQPGEVYTFPVSFYVDPKILDDPFMKDVRTVTLSYTFFPTVKGQ